MALGVHVKLMCRKGMVNSELNQPATLTIIEISLYNCTHTRHNETKIQH